jgi:hypothetical protein
MNYHQRLESAALDVRRESPEEKFNILRVAPVRFEPFGISDLRTIVCFVINSVTSESRSVDLLLLSLMVIVVGRCCINRIRRTTSAC